MTKHSNIAQQFEDLRPLFSALGNEQRQAIVLLLLKESRPLSVDEIVSALTLSQPAISHHLRILLQVGVVSIHKQGARHMYELRIAEGALIEPLDELIRSIRDCLEEVPS